MCGFQFIWRVLWSQILVVIVYITSTRVDLYSHQILFDDVFVFVIVDTTRIGRPIIATKRKTECETPDKSRI